jgi:LacI family transcriptional regulator, galactose operon repressor
MTLSRRPTVYDVAHQARVSIATVSRVLNSPEQVRPETRQKVLEAIDQLGFTPLFEASERARRSYLRIGILTPFFTYPSFVQRMRGIAQALSETTSELVIYPVNSRKRLESYLTVLPISRRLDGLILLSLDLQPADFKRLESHPLEAVLVESSHPRLTSIEIDDFAGGSLAAEHLLSRGHRCCAFIGTGALPDYAIQPEEARLAGFHHTLEANGLALTPDLIRVCPLQCRDIRPVLRQLIDLPQPPTAIFTGSDQAAIGLLGAARHLGVKVPDDLAVIGFDDIDMAEPVGLTTINQSLEESGQISAELLLARLDDPSRPAQTVRIQLELIVRETA